jgi:hypothetical protein
VNRSVAGAARGVAIVAALLVATFVAAACDGSPNPPPVTTVPPTSPITPTLTAEQVRCQDEGAFLVDVGTQLSRIVLNEGTAPGDGDEQQALTATQAQLDRLRGRTVHPPYVSTRSDLIGDATTIIEGNQGLLGPGHHAQRKVYALQVTSGGNDALAHAADASVKRSGCVPAG